MKCSVVAFTEQRCIPGSHERTMGFNASDGYAITRQVDGSFLVEKDAKAWYFEGSGASWAAEQPTTVAIVAPVADTGGSRIGMVSATRKGRY